MSSALFMVWILVVVVVVQPRARGPEINGNY
jgi:hypothetical protein